MTNEPLSDDEWITKNAQYLKDGFRKTKTFKAIIDGTIQGCKDKGDKDGLIEIYRPLFEELYLNGCVQGVHGQRIADKKQQKSSVARILNEIDGLDIITSYINSDGDDISGDGINEIKEIIKKHLGADLLPEEKK